MARPITELSFWVSSVSHNQKLRAILKRCFNWFFEELGEVSQQGANGTGRAVSQGQAWLFRVTS